MIASHPPIACVMSGGARTFALRLAKPCRTDDALKRAWRPMRETQSLCGIHQLLP